jgi:phosphoglycerate dehydrogenase-like enzyme
MGVNTPDANDISVAKHFFGLALILSKTLKKADIALREGQRGLVKNTPVMNFTERSLAFSVLAGLEGPSVVSDIKGLT